MPTLNWVELMDLVQSANALASALSDADDEDHEDADDDQPIRVAPSEEVTSRIDFGGVFGLVGGRCWQIADLRFPVVYPDRSAAHAELAIMLKIIRNAVTNLPDFGSVTVDDVPARGG